MRQARLGMIAILLAAAVSRAADFEKTHEEAIKANPQGVKFTLSLSQKEFHLGETIFVELSFSSTEADRWQIDGATYDRSGRLSEDWYVISPAEKTADPLAGYFEGMLFGGGLRQMPMLTEKPFVLKFPLNEWVRIDAPGTYKLYVNSSRLTDLNLPPQARQTVPLASDVVTFEVKPADAAWEKQELAAICKALDESAASSDTQKNAVQRLRFLGTADAAMELAKRHGENENDWHFRCGLIGMRDRATAIAAMRERLIAPDQKVTARYLETLGQLEELAARKDEKELKWGDNFREHQEQQQKLVAKAANELAAAQAKKTGAAKATCLLTLVAEAEQLTQENRKGLAAAVPAVWNDLTPLQQIDAMTKSWHAIKAKEMLPLLMAGYERKDFPQPFYGTGGYYDLCLKRAYELDAEKTRPVILEALKDPAKKFGRLTLRALMALPDETMPDLAAEWMSKLETSGDLAKNEVYTAMIRRYGDKEILPRMQKFYEKAAGRWACDMQTDMLAYFLRVSPEYGSAQVKFCLAQRGENKTGCWHEVLRELSLVIWTPELEAICADALTDAELFYGATTALSRYGSPAARRILIAALAIGSPEKAEQNERSLTEALTRATNWALTNNEMDELAVKLKSEQAKSTLDGYRAERAKPVNVLVYRRYDGELEGRVIYTECAGIEAVKAKMLQYPQGTAFKLDARSNQAGEAIETWAKENGIRMEKQAP